jgi:hypothetical protein
MASVGVGVQLTMHNLIINQLTRDVCALQFSVWSRKLVGISEKLRVSCYCRILRRLVPHHMRAHMRREITKIHFEQAGVGKLFSHN